ncbi:hypothetical protein [Streptodolium elevatio]|uniref:Uncharacterized protein n=1 Tax=Streptodolium elevatio TaxID=3157996 RepID=A0ABV3DDD4_9ACTN
MPSSPILRDALLLWFSAQTTPDGSTAHPATFFAEFQVDRSAARSLVHTLVHESLVQAEFGLDGDVPDGRVTVRGEVAAERLRDQGKDDVAVASRLRRELLLWLYRRERQGDRHPRLNAFAETDGAWFAGTRISTEAIHNASVDLREAGFIEGVGSWGAGILRPRLTSVGRDCVEDFGGNVTDYRRAQRSSGGTQININNPQGGQWAVGDTVTQTNTLSGVDAQAMAVFARALQARLPELGLSPDQEAEARDALQEIQEETASDTPQAARVQSRIQRVIPLVASSASPAFATMMMEAISQVGQLAVGG